MDAMFSQEQILQLIGLSNKEDYYSTSNASKCEWFKQINTNLENMSKRNG